MVVLRAEGRGFNAGVDIKEMQATDGFSAILGANRGCYLAFKAIYECPVPVIAAVNGFCLGGGVGLAGSADTIVASDDAYFGVPEVDRGALGAATHLSRLVPAHLLRTMYFTSRTITAQRLAELGSVAEVVPRDRLDEAAFAIADEIAVQGHPRHPRREGGPERDRPGRRREELPLRAGLHLRAQPRRRRRRTARRLRRHRSTAGQ